MNKKNSGLLFFISFFAFFCLTADYVDTIYGTGTITEPVLSELLQSSAFNRLKGINQYGVDNYIRVTKVPYTRHTHSLGVFMLLRMYGASLLEQIAGLLHDVSHTVFSHVGDHVSAQMRGVFLDQNATPYQDDKHLWLLSQTDIPAILGKYAIKLAAINHKNNQFYMLERSLPEICADRLEYNLYGGYIEGWITEREIKELLDALYYAHGEWFFDDAVQARTLGELSIKLCQDIFAAAWNIGAYEWAAKALLRAVKIGLISMHDIHFGQDDTIMALLQTSGDGEVQHALLMVMNAMALYEPADESAYDLSYRGKFRGINPWVKTTHGLERLTDVDPAYKERFEHARTNVSKKRFFKEKKQNFITGAGHAVFWENAEEFNLFDKG